MKKRATFDTSDLFTQVTRASRLAEAALVCAVFFGAFGGCTSQTPSDDALSTHSNSGAASDASSRRNAAPGAATTPSPLTAPAASASPSAAFAPPGRFSPTPVASSAAPSPAASPSPTEMAGVPVVPDRIIQITVDTGPDGVQRFNPPQVEARTGQQIEVVLQNNEAANSGIVHNWVLIKPGSEPAVVALGKEAGVDPDAVTYSPSILAATRTIGPTAKSSIDFVAPEAPGSYPFLSLVGDQWKLLRGTLLVRAIR